MSAYRLLVGDCRAVLPTLPAGSVHCVVTSPPFYGLRDYGVAGQLGLEPTPAEYVDSLLGVFREVWRVLRDDGTVWLNLGDSYAGSWKNQGRNPERGTQRPINGPMIQSFNGHPAPESNAGIVPAGLKPKDLCMIPARVALALQADGWWIRSDVIFSKPNPMPESVTDRPTKSHEYVFLLTKRSTYYYDAEAIAEEGVVPVGTRRTIGKAKADGMTRADAFGQAPSGNEALGYTFVSGTRNARTVWEIATQPYSGAHFATFPDELARRCILAGTSARGCCAECGAPWERVVERETRAGTGAYDAVTEAAVIGTRINGTAMRGNPGKNLGVLASTTTGWRPTCAHNAAVVPCVVLDPFAGSGTVGAVATGNGRAAILIELNPAYCELARQRCGPLLEVIA